MGKKHFHAKTQTYIKKAPKPTEPKVPDAEPVDPLPEQKLILGTIMVPSSHPSLSFFPGANPVA